MRLRLLSILLAIALGIPMVANAWFDDSEPWGRVMITRANTYETYQKDQDVFNPTGPLTSIDFFDRGDVDPDITLLYGGDPNNTFDCAWPVTFYFWFMTNSPLTGYDYEEARFQYHIGTNTASSANWVTIDTITNFPPSFFEHNTVHFGFLTWTPPIVDNSNYLLRVWAVLENGMENADQTALNIDSEGDGITWQDYEVLWIRAIPWKKPGSRSAPAASSTSATKSYSHVTSEKDMPKEPVVIIDQKTNRPVEKKNLIEKVIKWLNFWD